MNVNSGTYLTPIGALEVSEGRIRFVRNDKSSAMNWVFGPEGKFVRFEMEVGSKGKSVEKEIDVVFACPHVNPAYRGTVYSLRGKDGMFSVMACPRCVQLKGEVSTGETLNALPLELWKQIRDNINVVELM